MKYIIEIETDNDAFQGENLGIELSRILNTLEKKLIHYDSAYLIANNIYLNDINGNRVGKAYIR